MLKIAFVHQPWNRIVPPVQAGSVAILTYEFARRMTGVAEILMYSRKYRGQKKTEVHEDVTYRRFSAALDVRLNKVLRRFRRFFPRRRPLFSRTAYYFLYIWQVANDMRRQKVDVVHIHNLSQFVPVVRALNPNAKIVLHMHCEWLTQLDKSLIEPRLNKVDEVIAVCDYITNKIPAAFPQLEGRCRTIHNGVNLDEFDSKDRDEDKGEVKRVLFVGRVSPEKGIHVLLDAFELVVKSYPDVELEIVGPAQQAPSEFIVSLSDDPMTSSLSSFYGGAKYIDQLQTRLSPAAAERVRFAGVVPHSQLLEYLERANCFLHPSVWGEPFPLAVLEALAAGVPVVASRIGGLPESFEDGTSGLLVTPDDSGELADAILKLLRDDEMQKSMGKAARKRAEDVFSWDRVRDDLLALYEEVCSRN